MKFYLIECKHGHVGRDKYLPLVIPIYAQNIDEAISIARIKPGVKKDHKDRQSVCLGKTQPGYLMDTCLSGQDQYNALLPKFDIKG
jgi:hypothetical protein